MNGRAIIGGAAGGVAGALIWGAVSALTNYEVGYIAWGIGVLVGGGAALFEARGAGMGAVCAILALVSMLVGKMAAVEFSAPQAIREVAAAELSQQVYDEMCEDAEAFAQLPPDADVREFMLEHDFSEASRASEVPVSEVKDFLEFTAPDLRRVHEARLDYSTWRDEQTERAVDVLTSQMPVFEIVVDELGPMDIIFALLGVGTAYLIGSGRERAAA